MLSPSEGVVVRASRVPLVAELPAGLQDARLRVRLDGAAADDPLVVLRSHTRGTRLLAELDLSGVSPGEHRVEIEARLGDAPPVVVVSDFTSARGANAVQVRVRDCRGELIPARVVVWREGARARLSSDDAELYDSRGAERRLDSVFLVHGTGVLYLDDGAHTLAATRGIRDTVALAVLELDGAHETPRVVDLVVDRVVHAGGAIAADLHVHTARSTDVHVPDARRFRSLAVSGLDLVVITDHDVLPDLSVPTRALADAGIALRCMPGIESQFTEDQISLGHINAFPITGDAPPAAEDGGDLAAFLAGWRTRQREAPHPELGERLLLQLNHPRGIDFRPEVNQRPRRALPFQAGTTVTSRPMGHAPFNHPGLDRNAALGEGANAWLTASAGGALAFDTLEVVNRYSFRLYLETRADWFHLMNHGWFVTGTGNSDSHAATVELAGMPTNLIAVEGDPAALTGVISALETGRVSVSTGPVIDLRVRSGSLTGRPGDLISVSGPVEITAELTAAPWVPVSEVRLVTDGAVIQRTELDIVGDGGMMTQRRFEWSIDVERDTWVLVEAGWPLDGLPAAPDALPLAWRMVAPAYLPLGFTNPVRIDGDGDGRWSPTGSSGATTPGGPAGR